MQLSPETTLSQLENRFGSRYLSHVRYSHAGSFVRGAEWIGAGPVSLSKNQG